MTEKTRMTLNKASLALGIIIIVVGFIASMTRALDLSNQTAKTVEKLSMRFEGETAARISADSILTDAIANEREERKTDNTKQLVKLAEIDTKLFYLQQGQDQLLTYMTNDRNTR